MANPFSWFWYTATFKTKAVIIGLLAVLIAVALFWSCRDTKPAIDDDMSYQKLQGENNLLRAQNESLRMERDQAFSKGKDLELQRDVLKADLAAFGKKAAEGVKIQEEAEKEYEKDIPIIAVDIPNLDRCKRWCSHRAEMGFACKPNLDTFCERYAAAGN